MNTLLLLCPGDGLWRGEEAGCDGFPDGGDIFLRIGKAIGWDVVLTISNDGFTESGILGLDSFVEVAGWGLCSKLRRTRVEAWAGLCPGE